jgi:hypothetical protein
LPIDPIQWANSGHIANGCAHHLATAHTAQIRVALLGSMATVA